jgi:hypothetical protein
VTSQRRKGDPGDLDELKRQVADLAELTAAMRLRASLTPGTPEWEVAKLDEARLVEKVERWSRGRHDRPRES